MKYNEIVKSIYHLTGIKVKQREIAEILGMRVNAVGLRAARGSEFSSEDIETISTYYNIDLFSSFRTYKNQNNLISSAETAVSADENLKKLFDIIVLLSADNRKTILGLAERLKELQDSNSCR